MSTQRTLEVQAAQVRLARAEQAVRQAETPEESEAAQQWAAWCRDDLARRWAAPEAPPAPSPRLAVVVGVIAMAVVVLVPLALWLGWVR
ncbi:hypothetical protein [uncultured Arsenicicoccus sp.]|uniref:hypothetical protein n=1 Tax=uncultured Arsenicicoccus sp. TaxID=491339 RepID=UPI002597520E|nr:hypothetical protein [uncultured Arsenicicoccus sp.]